MTVEEILGKVFDIDPTAIKDVDSPDTIEAWDSFNGLLVFSELEKHYGVSFTIEEVIAVQKVGDIKKMLKKHGCKTE